MGKCTIIGKIRVPASVGQAILVNGKECDEETVWNLNAYGGESHVTDFTVENRADVSFDINFDCSSATDGEYTVGVYEDDGVTPVTSPFTMDATTTENLKFKLEFDKYIMTDTYEIVLEVDFI